MIFFDQSLIQVHLQNIEEMVIPNEFTAYAYLTNKIIFKTTSVTGVNLFYNNRMSFL